MSLWLWASVCLLFIFSVYNAIRRFTVFIARRKVICLNGCQPPNKLPSKDPILGLDRFLETYENVRNGSFLEGAQKRFSQYGNTHRLKMMGANAIFTIEPENIKTILSVRFKDYSLGTRRKNAFVPLLGHGIITTDGEAWATSRHLLRPNFARHQVGNLGIFEQHVNNLIRAIPRDGTTVDLQPLFFDMTIDTATEYFCGESTFCLAPERRLFSCTNFAAAFDRSQTAIRDHMVLGRLAALTPQREFRRDRDIVYRFIDRFVHKAIGAQKLIISQDKGARMDSEDNHFFVDDLAQRAKDPIQLRAELVQVLLAARDTTASLLSNLWFVLARRRDIFEKLRREIDCLGGKPPTPEGMKEMKYLRYCLQESLRLNPPVPVNGRTSVCDTILPRGGGADGRSPVFVPAGTMVNYHVYSMHRRKDLFGPDADEFMPERWKTLHVGWEYLPFNGGSRICLGQKLALTEASYTTVRLVQEFQSIESRDLAPWYESLTLTCSSANGTKVALTPANGSADTQDNAIQHETETNRIAFVSMC